MSDLFGSWNSRRRIVRLSSSAVDRKFFIQTFGCQMNEHDSEHLAGLLVDDGMQRSEVIEEADVIVLNTCCIREKADTRLYGRLGQLRELKRQRPEIEIAVGGCLAQKDRELIRQRADHVDVVFGTHNLRRAPELLRRAGKEGPLVEIWDQAYGDGASAPGGTSLESDLALPDGSIAGAPANAPVPLAVRRDLPHAAWVTIQTGCDNSCSFCIVPSVRGREVSRPLEEIVGEVRALVARGVTEVTLLGQNVNSYGRDITHRRPLFAELLREVGAIDGILRVRFTSPHPKDLRPETIAAMAETPSVCEHLHLPLQSGSDRILAAMRRGYTAQRYMARLDAARREVADLAVTTDLIVGFPGETDEDFERTLEVVASAGYDSAYTFIFSPRAGTRAAAMAELFIPSDVVRARFDALVAVVERSALTKHEARLGKHEEVILEGPSKRDPGMWTGRTRQNKLVHFQAANVTGDGVRAHSDGAGDTRDHEVSRSMLRLREGSRVSVEVVSASPHHLMGRLVAVLDGPRHRTHIPVRAG